MTRILFFVHYNKYDGLADYVLYLLKHIKTIYSRVVFISNSPISNEQQDKLAGLYDSIIVRENKGFDFGAWKDALLKEGWDNLAQYDSVTLMNDSCFGPIFDLTQVYTKMEQQDIDFWGLTNNWHTKHGMHGTKRPIPEHIQSYFMCFNINVVTSQTFQKFWIKVKYESNIKKIIGQYETQLTPRLAKTGFKHTVFFDANHFYHPDLCINNNIPFIKFKSLVDFKLPQYIIKLIKDNTSYPVSLIYEHMTDIYDPNTTLFIENKLIPAQLDAQLTISSQNIAVHLHVFYLDVFEKYIAYFDNYPDVFDLFFTTDTEEKKTCIQNYIQNHASAKRVKDIIIIENKGRDIFPWLSIAHHLNTYDIVGHFHTKKSPAEDEWVGITWLQDVFNLLLHPIAAIIETFRAKEEIGIIIPEIPRFFRTSIIGLHFFDERKLQNLMQTIWKKMSCKKTIDFRKLVTAIMPCGNMFWYRPAALQPLFNLKLSTVDIPTEPIPPDGTILHAIERIVVYVAWNEGYDYRIMVPQTSNITGFMDNILLNSVKTSRTYKRGEYILALPKIIKKQFKK